MIPIEDRRQTTCWVPAQRTIEAVLPLIGAKELAGIRKIVLADRGGPREDAWARYRSIAGTRAADIELYFYHFNEAPPEARESEFYLTYQVIQSLLHEIYHHWIRHKNRRRPTSKMEDSNADRWASQVAIKFVQQILGRPKEDLTSEWDLLVKAFKRTQDSQGPA
jgi:hypothetical protein